MNDLSFPPPSGRGSYPAHPSNDPFQPRLPLRRRKPRPKKSLTERAVTGLAIGAGAMGTLAVGNLITDTGVAANVKTLLLGASMTGVPYVVNTTTIVQGVWYAAAGYRSALFTSIASISLIGFTLATSTFSGLVIKDVADLQMQERVEEHGRVVAARSDAMLRSQRIIAAVVAVAADINAKAASERETSSISLKRAGGHGTVARILAEEAGRAERVSELVGSGKENGTRALAGINQLLQEFQEKASAAGVDVWQRRQNAELVDAKIRQSLASLDESMPAAAVAAYIGELRQIVVVPNDPQTSDRINSFRRSHSDGLEKALATDSGERVDLSPFKGRPGISEAVKYVSHFWTLGVIILVVEIIVPLLIWWFAYLAALARYDEDDRSPSVRANALRPSDPSAPSGRGTAIDAEEVRRLESSRKRTGQD